MALRIPDVVDMDSPFRASGLTPIDRTREVAVADLDTGDQLALQKFGPDKGLLWFCQLVVDDLDDAVALVFDVVLVDEDGNQVGADLVTGSTVGQGGGSVVVLSALDGTALPVPTENTYLAIDVTTGAGTPAAGQIRVVAIAGGNR